MATPRIRKLYYSIREVSERTGLKPHVLRYWETEFEQLQPKKNRAGNRAYTERDVETVEEIQRLLRDEKYTIEGARQALERGDGGDADAGSEAETVESGAADLPRAELLEIRAFLSDVLRRL